MATWWGFPMILRYRLSGNRFFFWIFGCLQLCPRLWSLGSCQFWPSRPLENLISATLWSILHPISEVSLWILGHSLLYLWWLQTEGKWCESHAMLTFWSFPVASHSFIWLTWQWSNLGRQIWCTLVSPLAFCWVSNLAACIPLDCGWEEELYVALSIIWGLGLYLLLYKNRLGSLPTPFAETR